MDLPSGVELYPLKSISDSRGFIREIFKSSWANIFNKTPKQVTHSFMTKNVVKAWHYHKHQTDWWYVTLGVIKVGLLEWEKVGLVKPIVIMLRSDSPVLLKIGPMVLHGLRVLSKECHLIYFTDREYDQADEGRLPYNDPRIKFNWGKNIIVSPKDERLIEI